MNHRPPHNPLKYPPAWEASTLRIIANHFDPGMRRAILVPDADLQKRWAAFLRRIADGFEDDPMPDAVAAEFEVAQAAQDYAGGDDGYDDDGEVLG
jgi:hypothetical protein